MTFLVGTHTGKQLCVSANLSQVKSRTFAGAFCFDLEAKIKHNSTGKHVFLEETFIMK
jgi:hypothetical protein